MTVSWLLKSSSTLTLISLLMAVLASSCSTENPEVPTDSNAEVPTDSNANDIGVINSTNNTDTNTNFTAVISGADNGSLTKDIDPDSDNLLEIGHKLNITDNDTGEAAFVAEKINGNYGVLTIDASGTWEYAADNNQSVIQNLTSSDILIDSLTISSIDGTTHTVTITIEGIDETTTVNTNQPAIISGTDNGSITEDIDPDSNKLLEVSGKLSITDSDSGEATFIAEALKGNYGSLTIDTDGNWNYTSNNDQDTIQNLTSSDTLIDKLTVSSIDGTMHTVVITIIGADETTNTTTEVNLSWTAPSEREDNNPLPLSEIAGYKVYYGTTQGNYSNSTDINDGNAEGHTFKGLSTGTYYFAVTTYDIEGRESQYSSEIKIII